MTIITLKHKVLHESVTPGRRLGRNILHDSRSLAYRVPRHGNPTSRVWERKTPVLDQGNLGSCTGNATVGALGTEPFYSTLVPMINKGMLMLDEAEAVKVYSRGSQLDPYSGEYPPTDTGSDGLSVAKAAKEFGLISGYTHALSVDDFISGMQNGPGICGISWLTGCDQPNAQGIVSYTGTVRGGHEIEAAEVDLDRELVWFWNSWGLGWGLRGKFGMALSDFEKALKDDGDATFFTPITGPAPTPTPGPVVPTDDAHLMAAMDPWEKTIISRITKAGKAKGAYDDWKKAKGYDTSS